MPALGNHHGLMDLGWGRDQYTELGLEFVPSRPELLGRTALKHSALPPSTLPLSKASLPIFLAPLSILLLLPTRRFSLYPCFPPSLCSVGPLLSLSLSSLPSTGAPITWIQGPLV